MSILFHIKKRKGKFFTQIGENDVSMRNQRETNFFRIAKKTMKNVVMTNDFIRIDDAPTRTGIGFAGDSNEIARKCTIDGGWRMGGAARCVFYSKRFDPHE